MPFTTEQFMQVLRNYNLAVWPAQVILNVLGLIVVYLSVMKTKYSDHLIRYSIALLWLWMGIVYHIGYFSTINPAAYLFGVAFILQGVFFVISGFLHDRLSFRYRWDGYGLTGGIMVLYALVFYPALGLIFGHTFPNSPTFGLPCPTTIFTFGILLWTEGKVPLFVIVIPFLWSLLGSTAAVKFGVIEDVGLLIAGITGTVMLMRRRRKEAARRVDGEPGIVKG